MSTDAKILLGIAGLTFMIIGGILALSMRNQNTESTSSVVAPENRDKLVRPDSQRISATSSRVTLVEFLDFECEACRAAYPAVKKLLDEYQGKITFVLRNFPLHGNSVLAAQAAEAAGEQDKFWAMYDLLFTKQNEWGEKKTPQTELFIQYAAMLGLDVKKFAAALESNRYQDKIMRDKSDGLALGIKGTPTFFLNNTLFSGVPNYDDLKKLVELELQASAP